MLGILPLSTEPLDALGVLPDLLALPGAALTTILVEITLTDPTALTLRFADHYVVDGDGYEWLGCVTGYGALEESQDGGPGAGEVRLTNTRPVAGKPRLSDLIRTPLNLTGTYEAVGAQVTLYRLGQGETIKIVLGRLVVEDAPDIDDREVRLRLRDASLRLEHQAPLTVVARADFPSCARDLPGTTIPLPFGTITGVPALPIVAGTEGRLVGDLTATATSFTVTAADGSDLDATDFTVKTVMIDAEEISFTTRTGNVISGATRAAGAVTHADGADVLEVLSTYIYAVGEHAAGFPVSSLSNIVTKGPTSGTPTITLDHVLAGRHLATISFPRSQVHALDAVSSAPVSGALSQYVAALVNGSGDANATRVATVPTAFAYCQRTRRSIRVTANRFGTLTGSLHLVVTRGLSAGSAVQVMDTTWATTVGGLAVADDVIVYDDATTAETFFIGYSMTGTVASGSLSVDVFATVQVPSDGFPLHPGGNFSSAADAALGPVSCDVVGIVDNATGTLTGTPATVLANPADVLRYLLTQFYPAPIQPLEAAAWAAARATLAARALVWGFLYGHDGPVALSDLRELAARQSGGALYVESGAWQFRVAEAPLTVELVLDYARAIWDGRPALATRSSSSDVYTSVKASAGFDYQTGAYRLTALADTAAVPVVQRTLEFPWVQAQATADALAAYWLTVWQRPRWEVELVAWTNLLGLRLGDQLALDGHPVLEAHGGADLALTITERSYLLGDENAARIRLRAVEAAPWA